MKYNSEFLEFLNVVTKDFKTGRVFKLGIASLFIWIFLIFAKIFSFSFGLDSIIFFISFLVSFLVWFAKTAKGNWQEIAKFLEEERGIEEQTSSFTLLYWAFRKYFLSKEIFLVVFFLGIIFDTFLVSFDSSLVVLFFLFWWLALNIAFKFESRLSIGIALFNLALCPFLLIFKMDSIAEKTAIWAYMFLATGVAQQLIELKKESKSLNVRAEVE